MSSYIYYMTFEYHGNGNLIGKSWREMQFDAPIESLKDINDAVEFEINNQREKKSFGGRIIDSCYITFYSLLRVEEEKKDTSKFEIYSNDEINILSE